MTILLLIIELITAIGAIITILLHSAKGEGLGGIGGQARLFHTQKDLEKNLTKLTSFFTITFILSAIILSMRL
ncbi:MAG: preprotein translocase subunit SecG [bacterium]